MGILGIIWAILGVSVLLLNAIIRLAPRGVEALQMELGVFQWILLVGFALFMMVAEGYRGFQKSFSPRTAARVKYLKGNPTLLRVLLAPFFAMGFFEATKKTKIVVWSIMTMVVLLITLVSQLPQPWRGIIDIGVVLGLSWGVISFWILTYRALTSSQFTASPMLPEGEPVGQSNGAG